MPLQYNVTEDKKLRVIIDTDAACEADDPFAIAHALMSKKLKVKAILAEQFGKVGSTKKSYDEIITVLEAMELSVPVYMGEEGRLSQIARDALSPAAECLIDEALKDDVKPLFVLCLGAITNVASAIRNCPEIAKLQLLYAN